MCNWNWIRWGLFALCVWCFCGRTAVADVIDGPYGQSMDMKGTVYGWNNRNHYVTQTGSTDRDANTTWGLTGSIQGDMSATYDVSDGDVEVSGKLNVDYAGWAKVGLHTMRAYLVMNADVTGDAPAGDFFSRSGSRGSAHINMKSKDTLRLVFKGEGPVDNPLFNKVNMRYSYHLGLFTEGGIDRKRITTAHGSIRVDAEVMEFDAFGEKFNFSGFLQSERFLNEDRSTSFEGSAGVSFGWWYPSGGREGIEYNNGGTTRLESITFADGTTPESHGFDIEFASGAASPNLLNPGGDPSPVPEPSTFALLGI
ncbi:MAG: hypothetical protein CMJ48_06670, partial [Planctomycetaceae bacterium]|nr:hypothetical protein [Planctomycetaceae bacterium]